MCFVDGDDGVDGDGALAEDREGGAAVAGSDTDQVGVEGGEEGRGVAGMLLGGAAEFPGEVVLGLGVSEGCGLKGRLCAVGQSWCQYRVGHENSKRPVLT